MKKENGFTLIETLVALTILSILLIIVSGLFSQFIKTQRRDVAELSLQEDVRSAMEFMSREIRTGYGSTFALDPTASPLGSALVFRNQEGQCVAYRTQKGQLQRAVSTTAGATQACDDAVSFGTYTTVTGAQTQITLLFLTPQKVSTASGILARQGFVTVVVKAVSATSTVALPLNLETTITSRQVRAYE